MVLFVHDFLVLTIHFSFAFSSYVLQHTYCTSAHSLSVPILIQPIKTLLKPYMPIMYVMHVYTSVLMALDEEKYDALIAFWKSFNISIELCVETIKLAWDYLKQQ